MEEERLSTCGAASNVILLELWRNYRRVRIASLVLRDVVGEHGEG